jgi:hypothetical protein
MTPAAELTDLIRSTLRIDMTAFIVPPPDAFLLLATPMTWSIEP